MQTIILTIDENDDAKAYVVPGVTPTVEHSDGGELAELFYGRYHKVSKTLKLNLTSGYTSMFSTGDDGATEEVILEAIASITNRLSDLREEAAREAFQSRRRTAVENILQAQFKTGDKKSRRIADALLSAVDEVQ